MGFKNPIARRAVASALSASWPITILTDETSDGNPSERNLRYADGETWANGELVSAEPFRGEVQFAPSADLMAESAETTAATVIHKYGGMAVVWHDDAIQPKPAWLDDWQDIGYNLLRNNRPYSSFVKSYRPGETVTFMGNGGAEGDAMYIPQLVTTYLSPVAVAGSGTIRLVTSADTVMEETNIEILCERVGGTQGVASAKVTLGANSSDADLKTASVSWPDGEAGQRVISVSASPVGGNVTVKVLVSASVLQSFDMTILNSAEAISGDTFVIDFASPTSGVGTTADPFNSWAHLNAHAPPTEGNLIYRTKGTAEGLVCSPPRGTSANARVIIQTSASTFLQGIVGDALDYAISLTSADYVAILASPDAPLVIDGEVLTAARVSAWTSVSGKDTLNGGYRFILEIQNSHHVEIRHLESIDTWGWGGVRIGGNSTDAVEFRSCSVMVHGLPGQLSPQVGDFADAVVVSVASGNNILFSHCFFGPGGHNSLGVTNGSVIVYRCVFDGDWTAVGANRGSRSGEIKRGAERSYLDQCIIRNAKEADNNIVELFKLEGENNVFRMSLFHGTTRSIAVKCEAADWTKWNDNNRLVHNTFWDIEDGMISMRYFSGASAFGRFEIVNNAINEYASGSPILNGDVYFNQAGTVFGRTWEQNLKIRGNLFSANADIVVAGGPGTQTLAYYQTNHASIIHSNTQAIGIYADPKATTGRSWANAWASASASFKLTSAWPGAVLTSAQATTNAANVRVADARYWRGTRGFSGLPDPFFAQGQAVNVLTVDYANNKLFFDGNVTLTSGANCYYFTSSDVGVPWAHL